MLRFALVGGDSHAAYCHFSVGCQNEGLMGRDGGRRGGCMFSSIAEDLM